MSKKSCASLLSVYEKKDNKLKAEKIVFKGVDGYDVYNITAPFNNKNHKIIAGRVEKRNSEDSKVLFFKKEGESWVYDKNLKDFRLQDPFITKINSELLFGGVEIIKDSKSEEIISWKTNFYRGDSINDLEFFAEGPAGMKDIRLIELPNGKIGVFTRPQGEIGGRGKIGFCSLNSLDELNAENIQKADLLNDQFLDLEWGGVNEVHLLENNLLGVLGHIAAFDQNDKRHYYPMCFAFDYLKVKASKIKIIAQRRDLPEGPAKRKDLEDVLFSGGLIRKDDGLANLYLGVSDVEAYKLEIQDPFHEYEADNFSLEK